MALLKSFLSLLLSIVLISLLYWGLSKFVLWYPTINNFIFYFLAFWFLYVANKLFSSILHSIKSLKIIIKDIGYTSFQIFRIVAIVILLIICLAYLGKTIYSSTDLYKGWKFVGLLSFCLFTIQLTIGFLKQFLLPINE